MIRKLAPALLWAACLISGAAFAAGEKLTILSYHEIAEPGESLDKDYTVSPTMFVRQMDWLRNNGYRFVTVDDLLADESGRRPLPEKAVLITFDDGYRDFLTDAWPLLRAYGFGAALFVTTGHVGGCAEWDRAFGTPAELLGWDELRGLAAAGVEIGAHGRTHAALNRLSLARMVAEGRDSRQRLEAELGRPVVTMAYPFGEQNLMVRRAMAGCGYQAGLTTLPGLASLGDNVMSMPRQLISGDEDFDAFVAKLGRPERATIDRRLRYAWARYGRQNLM